MCIRHPVKFLARVMHNYVDEYIGENLYVALNGDLEYKRLMKIVTDDFTAQLERVGEMERNGEIPPHRE